MFESRFDRFCTDLADEIASDKKYLKKLLKRAGVQIRADDTIAALEVNICSCDSCCCNWLFC